MHTMYYTDHIDGIAINNTQQTCIGIINTLWLPSGEFKIQDLNYTAKREFFWQF